MCALVTGVQACALPIYQKVIVQSGGSFVADGKIRNSVKALAAFQIVILVDPDQPEHVGSRPLHIAQIIGVIDQAGKVRVLKIDMYREFVCGVVEPAGRSEEHTSELQSLMRRSYAVFCLKKN